MHPFRDRRDAASDSVHSGQDDELPFLRFEVNVGRALFDRRRKHLVDEADSRCGGRAAVAHVRDRRLGRDFLVVAAQRLDDLNLAPVSVADRLLEILALAECSASA